MTGKAVPSRAGFWAVAYALAVLIGGANLATPLYEVYRAEPRHAPPQPHTAVLR